MMKKILARLKSLIPTKQRLIQLYSALLFNANIKGFFNGKIYKGPLKNMCAPGINCYSCPGASAACPLGALQNSLAESNRRGRERVSDRQLAVPVMLSTRSWFVICAVYLNIQSSSCLI